MELPNRAARAARRKSIIGILVPRRSKSAATSPARIQSSRRGSTTGKMPTSERYRARPVTVFAPLKSSATTGAVTRARRERTSSSTNGARPLPWSWSIQAEVSTRTGLSVADPVTPARRVGMEVPLSPGLFQPQDLLLVRDGLFHRRANGIRLASRTPEAAELFDGTLGKCHCCAIHRTILCDLVHRINP